MLFNEVADDLSALPVQTDDKVSCRRSVINRQSSGLLMARLTLEQDLCEVL